jgi:hypothetical protein
MRIIMAIYQILDIRRWSYRIDKAKKINRIRINNNRKMGRMDRKGKERSNSRNRSSNKMLKNQLIKNL